MSAYQTPLQRWREILAYSASETSGAELTPNQCRELLSLLPTPERPYVSSSPNVDGQNFYELCQQYRHSKEIMPHPSLPNTVQAFNNLREYIKTGKLPWPSYESDDIS